MDINELREATREYLGQGYSQSALARISGVSQSVISLFLSGAGLSVKNYNKLLDVVRG